MQIIEAKLMDLKIDPANVRQTDKAPDEGLLASIRAKGLIYPLTVRKNVEGYYVTDGGKRLAALHLLARDGEYDKATPIACVLRDETDATARDISLTTNFIREDMHPVDVYEAFADLRDAGKSTEDISKEYGLSVPAARQFLALGSLSAKVRHAWKTGSFGMHDSVVAKLFTLAGDHAQQDAIFDKLKKQKRLDQDWQVREAIVGNSNDTGRLVTFVGAEAYKDAGGQMIEDLFGSNHRIEDPAIAVKLVNEKLKEECAKAVALGWSWAEPLADLPKGCQHSWQRAYDFAEQFAKTKRKEWGLALHVDQHGKLDEYILQKPEQKKAADKAAKTKEKNKAAASSEAPEKEDGKLSAALNTQLTAALTEAAAQAIINEPDLAFSIALASLMSSDHGGGSAVRVTGHGYGARHREDESEWDFPKALAHALKLTPKQRAASFAMYVGMAFDFTDASGSPCIKDEYGDGEDARLVLEAIDAGAMKKALLEKFNASVYFAGINKAMCIKTIMECLPGKYAEKDFGSNKKADVALIAEDAAHDTSWLPPELRTKFYDGPGSKGWKASAAKKPAAKAKAAKKKAR